MKPAKTKPGKRLMIVRVTFMLSILLVFISVWQLFFESPENSQKVTHWFVMVLWSVFCVLNWFQLKILKKALKKESQIPENHL